MDLPSYFRGKLVLLSLFYLNKTNIKK